MPPVLQTSHAPKPPPADRSEAGSIALDQWRGLALVFVLISHGFYFTGRVHGIGRVGVNLFFFISGILVFRSLSRGRAATAWGRTRAFWWRRFRRLYPALLSYSLAGLVVVWLVQHQSGPPPNSGVGFYLGALPIALVYGTNYFVDQSPMALGHLWSLACEMQFYLVAPLIYWLGGRTERRRNLVFGSTLVVLMGLGVAEPLLRHWYPGVDAYKYHFEFAVWPMLLGFCCEYKRNLFLRCPGWLVTWALWLGGGLCGASLAVMIVGFELKNLLIATGALLLVPCLMAYLFGRPMSGPVGGWLRWMGERTYSIYLWQQPFTICGFIPTLLHPLGAIISVGVGGVWFHYFEQPFLSSSRKAGTATSSKASGWPKAATIGLSTVVLLMLLAGWSLHAQYENRLRREIWPVAPVTGDVQANEPVGSVPTLLLLGDSRVAQWGLPHLPRWRVINAGIGGLTTGQLRLQTAGLLDKFHPEAVIVEAGINDLKFLGLRPGFFDSIVPLAASNLLAVARQCAARNCKVLLLEVWPPGEPDLLRRAVWSDTIPYSVQELNSRLRQAVATETNIYVVDLFAKGGLKREDQVYLDTLHFARPVYQRLTPVLESELEAVRGGGRAERPSVRGPE